MKKRNLKEIGYLIITCAYTVAMAITAQWIMGYKITMINGSIFIIAILLAVIVSLTVKNFSNYESKMEIEDYYDKIRNSIVIKETSQTQKEDTKDISDIIELMLLNMKEIKEYYVMSKDMAKKSFTLSVIMCIFGFCIILLSIIAMFLTDITLIESLIPVIGGAVVEVIAGTSLIVYKKSLEQLNQYYEALHSNERYLSLVNLVDKLTDDKKDETYINIINSQLEKLK